MKQFKGTPGPWKIDYATKQWAIVANNRMVAEVPHLHPDAKRNLQAIAACPMLIEALQELLRFDSALRAGAEHLQYPDNLLKAIEVGKAALSAALD